MVRYLNGVVSNNISDAKITNFQKIIDRYLNLINIIGPTYV